MFHSITSLFLADFMDYGLSIAPFCVGFVMFAGSGFNLNQQFGLPLWTDSAIVVVLVPLMTAALLLSIQDVYDADLPTLALIDKINPVLGVIAFVGTYLMIFSTSLGVFFSLGKRLAAPRPS
ncbi:hypothetical protein [Kocuria sp. CPCC 205261]|uniref:hypothetical protein n=1 Tax=Kocuria sp. CPCC 205261 TaxID=3073554 RepID=UPI0034D6BB2F